MAHSNPPNQPDNQADWLGIILQSLYENGTGINNDLPHYDPETAYAAITTKIAEERIDELKLIKRAGPFVNACAVIADDKKLALDWLIDAKDYKDRLEVGLKDK